MISLDARRESRAARKSARERFLRARFYATKYGSQLSAIARHVGAIVRGFAPAGRVEDLGALEHALARYSSAVEPWAQQVGSRMLAEVSRRDERAWFAAGREIGRNLRTEIEQAPVGHTLRALLEEQVELITSLPIDAGRRVHKLAVEAQIESTRAAEIAAEILRSGDVTKSRAMLIARTEVARAASTLTEARATHIGSTGYIWRTSRDADVRESHREMEGRYCRWDTKPLLSDGTRTAPGGVWNCRCWSEPLISEDF